MLSAYVGLFFSAFIAATLLPMGSEAVMAGLLLNDYPFWPIVLTATAGNVLGSMVNYGLGQGLRIGAEQLNQRQQRRLASLAKAEQWFARYGVWSLLFAWLPIIGDPLTLVAGFVRVKFWLFTLLVTLGKFTRYFLLALAVA